MNEDEPSFDVFISHGHQEADVLADIASVLRSYDLRVFTGAEGVAGRAMIEDVIWEAMSESQALVAIVPEAHPSAWFTFELGAARAWNKPIYAVASNPATARLPVGLQGMIIYPPSRIEEIAQEIKRASESLSRSDQGVLVEEYRRIGVTVDQLLLQPEQLSTLAKQFKKRAKRDVTAEELLRTLLRLRKRGELGTSSKARRPKAIP